MARSPGTVRITTNIMMVMGSALPLETFAIP